MYDLVIRSARIVTPSGIVMGDLGIKDDIIAAIGQGLGPGREEMEATGLLLFPGIVDTRVHFGATRRGFSSADDMESGTRAAAFGGVTCVLGFAEQAADETLAEAFTRRRQGIEGKAHVDVGLHSDISVFGDTTLEDMAALRQQGVGSFRVCAAGKEQVAPLTDGNILSVAAQAAALDAMLMVHAENGAAADFLSERAICAATTDPTRHSESHPELIEAEAIYRLATLARLAECPLYVSPLSSARSLDLIRRFRSEDWTIFTETNPHYLLLDADLCGGENGQRYITQPPLRGSRDRQGLTSAVMEGEIEVISSGHCPFTAKDKDSGGGHFMKTPPGLPGVETLFQLMFSHIVALGDGGLTPRSNASLLLLSRVLAENPSRIFGLAPRKGSLQEGADADIIVFDPNPVRRVRAAELKGAADWDPYDGAEVRGSIRSVFLRGRKIVDEGHLFGQPGDGRFVGVREKAERAVAAEE